MVKSRKELIRMGYEMIATQHKRHYFLYMSLIMFFMVPHVTFAQAPGSVESSLTQNNIISSDICPEPKAALSNSPDDLSKIQEEITRLNLCVQRAQLLERLNSLVLNNIQTIDSAIEANFSLSMPEVSIPPITAIEIEGVNSNNSPSLFVSEAENEDTSDATIWKIKNIKGGGDNMEAVLVDNNGYTLSVRIGDKLPNQSGGIIHSIGPMGVKVKIKSDVQRLQWMN